MSQSVKRENNETENVMNSLWMRKSKLDFHKSALNAHSASSIVSQAIPDDDQRRRYFTQI